MLLLPPPRDEEVTAAMYGFNFTDSGEKETCRLRNIGALQGSKHLIDRRTNALRLDWLELAGLDAPTSLALSDRRMLGSAKFIGVDIERSVIDTLIAQERPFCEFYHSSFENLVTRMRNVVSRVGVLNLDTTHGWQGARRPPIVEDCAVASEFIVSRLAPPADSGELPAQEFLFIVNAYVRKVGEVLPTIDRALAPLRAACKALRTPVRVANLISYPSRGRTSEMINLVLAIGY